MAVTTVPVPGLDIDPEASVYGNQPLPDTVEPEPAFDGGHAELLGVEPHAVIGDPHLEMSVFHVDQYMGIQGLAVLHDIGQQFPHQLVQNRFHVGIQVLERILYVAEDPDRVSFHQPLGE